MLTGKFLRVRVRNPGNCGKQSGKFLEGLECFQTCWRIFGRSEKFLVCLDSFRTVPNSLRSFRMVWQVCSHLGGLYFTVGCQVQYGNKHKNNALDFAPDQFTMHMLFTKTTRTKFTHSLRKVLQSGKFKKFWPLKL